MGNLYQQLTESNWDEHLGNVFFFFSLLVEAWTPRGRMA